jgi:DNA-binding SARP family transcriptional activator
MRTALVPGGGGSEMAIEFRLLGDIEVRVNGQIVDAGHARQRCVLAVLLVQVNRLVSSAELIDRVWGEQRLPGNPGNALQTYISLLRRAIATAGEVSITREAGGYKLAADAISIDVNRFDALINPARGSDDARAALLLEQALGLWRGNPFANLDTPWINSIRSTVAAQRHAAQLDLADAQLRLGQHAAVIAGLSGQVAAHPLDERLAGQYMTALYRSGRRADALSYYRHIRRHLVAELGTEPGAALRHLHQQMLRSDPALRVRPGSPPRTTPVDVPRQLPADVAGFTGRGRHLAELDLLLPGIAGEPGDRRGAGGRPAAPMIFAVSGTAGVGKTALAVHWAHQVAEWFPDGQLYVNLRGYDPERPVTANEALGGFLRALGVADQDIPADTAERAAKFRSLLAGRRMLVLLDNAGEAEQVRPLLPGNPACVTLATSRSSLTGLVARDGAVRLDLDLLAAGEAVALLRALIGPRADAEPQPVAALAEQCARLPLALRVAAELAIARPARPLADLVAELADKKRRLDLLEAGGDPRTAVRAVFSWSCRQLDPGTLRVFWLAGLHPGPDIDAYEVAALAEVTADRAGQALGFLDRVHLIHNVAPGRYGMHDLLRAYAREVAAAQGADPERRKAPTRLLGYHLYTAASVTDALLPDEGDWVPDYLGRDDDRGHARKAVWGLAKAPGPEAERALRRLLEDPETPAWASALLAPLRDRPHLPPPFDIR